MTVVNTKLKNGVYVPDETVNMDPYSEYEHETDSTIVEEPVQSTHHQQVQVVETTRKKDPMGQITENIDNFFDGVDMVFGIFNHVGRRYEGGKNARRRKSNK